MWSQAFHNLAIKIFQNLKKRGLDISKLCEVVDKLRNGEKLEPKYRDHALIGNYKNCRECHINPDWLLIYEIVDDKLVLILYRNGKHSELF